jgi:magnesium transporter
VLPVRDLVFADPGALVSNVMIRSPKSVRASDTLDDLRQFFDDSRLVGAPVVDEHNRLVGVVRPAALEQASAKRMTKQFLKFSGIVGGEEFRSMPFFLRSGRRLSWLSINIVLNLVAATVIAAYQDTLAAAITLAVFLPMISDMSGCSGNQAVAVSMRELTLGLVRPNEIARVLGKEASIGIVNGFALGILLGGLAFLWKGNPYLGFIVGIALAANTVVAVSVGGLLPLIFKRLRLDPALVSGPALTTITDMCGFFIVLSMATVMLPKL